MLVDLHNHTTLCNHAKGSMESYIEAAIAKKIDVFGFADHAPMSFDKEYRMTLEQMPFYEKDVLALREKFADKIKIPLGYEVDFLDGYIDNRVLDRPVDYFIGSVHFLGTWGFDNPEFIGQYQNKDIDKIWQDYFDAIEKMANYGAFDIVGHIDLMKIFNFLPKKDVRIIAKNAIKAIKKANMTIELNAAGYRKPIKEQYPSNLLLEIIAENDISITFGSDAHALEQVGFCQEELREVAKKHGFTKCAMFEKRERILVTF